MEPLSILGSAGAVTKLAYGCTASLYTFISGVKNIDVTIQALHDEVGALPRTATSVEATLNRLELQAFQDIQLWTDVNASLITCAASLKSLKGSLQGMQPNSGRKILGKGIAQVKLDLKSDGIRNFRAQIHSHRLALETILQAIGIHVSTTAPVLILNEVSPQLRVLMNTISLVQDDVRTIKEAKAVANQPLDDHESLIIRTNEQLAISAQLLVSERLSAADNARSTIFGGTETELDFESSIGGITIDRRGLPHRPAPMLSRISEWVSSNETHVNETMSNNTVEALKEQVPSTVPQHQGYESDDEDEVDVVGQYVQLGRAAALERNDERAESFLRKALENPRLLTRLPDPVAENTIKHELAIALFNLGRAPDSRAICQELINLKIRDDSDRRIVLDTSFTLAQIDFSENYLQEAESMCRQVVKGRRRLSGKSDAYFSTITLLTYILKARGEEHRAEAYVGLLPPDFQRPVFKTPVPGARKDSAGVTRSAEIQNSSTGAAQIATIQNDSRILTRESAQDLLQKRLVGNGWLSNMKDIHWAVAQADEPTIKQLISKASKPLVDVKGPYEFSPLHIASMLNHDHIARFLLNAGAKIDSRDTWEQTPLYWAAATGKIEVAKILLENGAEVDAKTKGLETPLKAAVYYGHLEIVRLLLERGAVVDYKDTYGNTPLHYAVRKAHLQIVRILLEKGADKTIKNLEGRTPVQEAQFCGLKDVEILFLKWLITKSPVPSHGRQPSSRTLQTGN